MIKLESIPLLAMKEGALWAYLNVPEDKPQGASINAIKDDSIPF